jgi:hypothetical protein
MCREVINLCQRRGRGQQTGNIRDIWGGRGVNTENAEERREGGEKGRKEGKGGEENGREEK